MNEVVLNNYLFSRKSFDPSLEKNLIPSTIQSPSTFFSENKHNLISSAPDPGLLDPPSFLTATTQLLTESSGTSTIQDKVVNSDPFATLNAPSSTYASEFSNTSKPQTFVPLTPRMDSTSLNLPYEPHIVGNSPDHPSTSSSWDAKTLVPHPNIKKPTPISSEAGLESLVQACRSDQNKISTSPTEAFYPISPSALPSSNGFLIFPESYSHNQPGTAGPPPPQSCPPSHSPHVPSPHYPSHSIGTSVSTSSIPPPLSQSTSPSISTADTRCGSGSGSTDICPTSVQSTPAATTPVMCTPCDLSTVNSPVIAHLRPQTSPSAIYSQSQANHLIGASTFPSFAMGHLQDIGVSRNAIQSYSQSPHQTFITPVSTGPLSSTGPASSHVLLNMQGQYPPSQSYAPSQSYPPITAGTLNHRLGNAPPPSLTQPQPHSHTHHRPNTHPSQSSSAATVTAPATLASHTHQASALMNPVHYAAAVQRNGYGDGNNSAATPSTATTEEQMNSAIYVPRIQLHGRRESMSDRLPRRFVCHVEGCGRAFTRNFNLQSHLKAHLGIREFKCKYCDKHFSRRHDRMRHCNAIHKAQMQEASAKSL